MKRILLCFVIVLARVKLAFELVNSYEMTCCFAFLELCPW